MWNTETNRHNILKVKELISDDNHSLFSLFLVNKPQNKYEKLRAKLWVSSYTYEETFTSNLAKFSFVGYNTPVVVHKAPQKAMGVR